jgi:hypothetical protein
MSTSESAGLHVANPDGAFYCGTNDARQGTPLQDPAAGEPARQPNIQCFQAEP